MIIFDNIIFSLQKAGGISVVWSELLKRIITSGMHYKCMEYTGHENNIFRKTLDIPESNIIKENYPLLYFQRYFNPHVPHVCTNTPFIFHSSYYRFCPCKNAVNITTVHDFTYEYFLSGPQKILHCRQKYRAIRHSDYIICISETTKKDLLKFVKGTDESKIHVIYNGVSDDYHVVTDIECNAQYGKFMLFVGSREVYKNFNLAVMASRRANMNLVIVGSRLTGKEIKFLEKELGKHRFFSLSGIPNSELNILYNQAHCFLYLSSYEGFGIPVLEAQKAGCPVITLDAPSVVEIIGDTTLVADTKDVDSIVEKIEMLSDESLRKTVIESGMRNAKKYNWDKMAEQVLVLYANAIKTKDLTSRINER